MPRIAKLNNGIEVMLNNNLSSAYFRLSKKLSAEDFEALHSLEENEFIKKIKEELKEYHRKYCQENPEKKKEHNRKYCQENTEKIKEYHRKYKKEKKAQKNNKLNCCGFILEGCATILNDLEVEIKRYNQNELLEKVENHIMYVELIFQDINELYNSGKLYEEMQLLKGSLKEIFNDCSNALVGYSIEILLNLNRDNVRDRIEKALKTLNNLYDYLLPNAKPASCLSDADVSQPKKRRIEVG